MTKSFTPQLKKILLKNGCLLQRQGKGDHEICYSPLSDKYFVVIIPLNQDILLMPF